MCAAAGSLTLFPAAAMAQSSGAVADSGHTAWLLAATALVLFMTLPGLALFYAGLVQAKNAVSVLMQCVAIACLASVLWFAVGYSIAFTEPEWPLFGSLSKAFLLSVPRDAVSGQVPESVFFMYQMTFAVITPALIVGAYVERIRFAAVLLFSGLWLLAVYAPVAHWVWGGGWLGQRGVMDFAGGLVVHATAGISALAVAAALGAREGFPKDTSPPFNPGYTMIGAAMLWVGWFGFNGGSALLADSNAGLAISATHLSAATATLVWATIEWIRFGKPSMVGAVTGAIAGLATITPASGYVGPMGGVILGAAGAVVCFLAVPFVKQRLKVDDSLDVFAVHGVGGILGTLGVSFLAAESLGGVGYPVTGGVWAQLEVQSLGVAATLAWSALASVVIIAVTSALVGLRASDDEIVEGLDLTQHGERIGNP
ncbi:MAG: ammonium transporter [Alphaproteobacteria bacterium]|nr:ammonium transporter [Alphaproteobacteria bacterium]